MPFLENFVKNVNNPYKVCTKLKACNYEFKEDTLEDFKKVKF